MGCLKLSYCETENEFEKAEVSPIRKSIQFRIKCKVEKNHPMIKMYFFK